MLASLVAHLLAVSGADLSAPELKASAGYEFRLKPVPQVLSQLRKETGLEIKVDPRLADRRLTALVTDQPRREFMTRMAEVLGAQWVGLRLTQREDVALYEKNVVGKNLAASKKLLLADFLALIKESDRSFSSIRDEISRTEKVINDLRRDRPSGWGDQFTAGQRRIDKLKAFERSPGLYSFMRLARNWPETTWHQMVAGKRFGAWLAQEGLAGGKWFWIVGDPVSGRVSTSDSGAEGAIDSFDWPDESSIRVLPAGPGKGITREFRGRDGSWRDIPFSPGDLDVLETAHRELGIDTVSEGLLTRGLSNDLASQPIKNVLSGLTELARRNAAELRLEGNWITYVPKAAAIERLTSCDIDLLQAVERGGANDLPSLVKFITDMNGMTRSRYRNFRVQAELGQLIDDVELFDFLSMLTANQLADASRGKAIPYVALSPMAKNLFRQFAVEGLRSSRSAPEFAQSPAAWDSMYFYLERYLQSIFSREVGQGKTIRGGINDGVLQGATPDRSAYQVELNFFFGVDFANSAKRTTKMGTMIPPPYKADPNAKPPEHHEGHGPGI